MYTCKYFKIEELVNPAIIASEQVLWELFDSRLLKDIDFIRGTYGPIIINSKALGLRDCGLRAYGDVKYPAYDPHKFGRAFDLHIMSIENENLAHDDKVKAYNDKRNLLRLFANLSDLCFEDNISWLHIDTFNRPEQFFNKENNNGDTD
jgi:hypothetical protein